MKKSLFATTVTIGIGLVFALLISATPAFAQHGGSHGGGSHGSSGGGHSNGGHASVPAPHNGGGNHATNHEEHQHGNNNQVTHNEIRHDEGRRGGFERRDHWDGRHFDRGYFRGYFGREHCFYPGRAVWFGGYWGFYYSGWQFELYEAYPWYDDPYYIDEDGDVYWIYSPRHPGWRMRVYVVVP